MTSTVFAKSLFEWFDFRTQGTNTQPVFKGYNPLLKANYLGVGADNNLLMATYNRVTSYGIVELNGGRFTGASVNGYQLGFYYPFGATKLAYQTAELGQTQANGWYIRGLLGDVDTSSDGTERTADFGVGLGLSYLWLNPDYLAGLGVSGALRKTDETQTGTFKSVEPVLLLSARFGFGF